MTKASPGQKQEISVTLEMMRQLQAEYGVDGWYLDNANAGEVLDDYDYMRQIRTDVGEEGIMYHHDSVDIWGLWCGLRAIFIDAYVNYTLVGETSNEQYKMAEVDSPNDEYFRYFSGSYGMSQAYASHTRRSTMETALSWKETRRVMGQNLNGCERAADYNYDSWVSHFKPVYEIRKAEYLNDANVPFVPDVDWPIDTDPNTGGWFRDVDANDVVVNIIDSNTVEISWTTPEPSDSEVVCTHVNNGVWWFYTDSGGQQRGPDGNGYDSNMVTDHNAIELSLFEPMVSGDKYELKIRSTNDVNDPPAVPGQIIWGHIGMFEYE